MKDKNTGDGSQESEGRSGSTIGLLATYVPVAFSYARKVGLPPVKRGARGLQKLVQFDNEGVGANEYLWP
jgi:hypothetical protein